MQSDNDWRAGFEVEVVLGDLDDDRFYVDLDDPMDVASPTFCQAVARQLSLRTGRSWVAPKKSPVKTGFFVLEEYDLDPLYWPYGRVAGVELLTPPLPLDEAEKVRREIIDAIADIDGHFNFRRSDVTDGCAWHINIDAGPALRIDPEKYMLGFEELPLLAENGRLFSKYASPQRHAFGRAILRHLRSDPSGNLLIGTGLSNLLRLHAGRGKRYACNFLKLEFGYVELRHFSALTFFNGPPLPELIAPITTAFDMWAVQETPPEQALLRRFMALQDWLSSFRSSLRLDMGPMETMASGRLYLGRQKIADLLWNGSFEIGLRSRKRHHYIAEIFDIHISDVPEAVALLALDLAELAIMGQARPKSGSAEFQALLDDLTMRFTDPGLQMPRPDKRLREQIWDRPERALPSSMG